MTRSGIEPRPPATRADALTTMLRGAITTTIGTQSYRRADCCFTLRDWWDFHRIIFSTSGNKLTERNKSFKGCGCSREHHKITQKKIGVSVFIDAETGLQCRRSTVWGTYLSSQLYGLVPQGAWTSQGQRQRPQNTLNTVSAKKWGHTGYFNILPSICLNILYF